FLDINFQIMYDKKTIDLIFILSDSSYLLQNNYLTQINILSEFNNIKFYFTTLSIKRKVIKNEDSYVKLLKEVYGYEAYKEIEFYKSIEGRSKQTLKISQAQIIDDIVNQAEKAMFGEDFRDVYIKA